MTIFPKYMVGGAIIEQAAEELTKLGKRPLIIGGHRAMEAALPRVLSALQTAGLEYSSAQHYGHECTYAHMKRLAEIAKAEGADFIIGIGGGKALDTAKGCAHLLNLPIATIPTIAATCAAITALSVVYTDESVFVESMFHDAPPDIALIDLGIIARSPHQYLRAGIGDAIAKHVECSFAIRGRELSHSCAMAAAISQTSFDPLLRYGIEGLRDAKEGKVSFALEQVVLSNIVSTGLVSLLIDECYNGAIAHALFYGLTKLEGFETRCLHGDAVGYGVLIQQMLDGQLDSFQRLRLFMKEAGMPVSLREMGYQLNLEVMDIVVPASIKVLNDSRTTPYPVQPDMLKNALMKAEAEAQ